jgi:MFS family permease
VGAAVVPLTLGLTRDVVPADLRERAVGVLVGAGNVGATIGFIVRGLLVDWFAPVAIFWFLFPFSALLMAGVFFLVGESPVRTRVQLDVVGATLLGAGLVALLLAISKGEAWGWSSGAIVGLFVASAVAFTAFFAAVVAYALVAVSHDTVGALVGSAAVGVGWGAITASFYSLVLGHAAADKAAVSVSVPLVFRNIGASVGVTVAFVVLSSGGSAGPFPADDGCARAFVVSAAACVVVALAGLSLAGRRRSSR